MVSNSRPPTSNRGPARVLLAVLGFLGLLLAVVMWTRLRFVPPFGRAMLILFGWLTLAFAARVLLGQATPRDE